MAKKREEKNLIYRVVEITTVTDQDIENTINACVKEGWNFENIQFVVKESSRRPSMAFIIFTKKE